ELLLLLVAKAGELALELLALGLLPGLLEGGLQLAHLPVQVLLPLGQLAQPIEHLAGLALLALLLRGLGRALRLVAVLLVLQVEVVELLLPLVGGGRLRALLAL